MGEDDDVAGLDRHGVEPGHAGEPASLDHDIVRNDMARRRQDDAGEGLRAGYVDAPRVGGVDQEEQRPLQPHRPQDVRERVAIRNRAGLGRGRPDKHRGRLVMGAGHGFLQSSAVCPGFERKPPGRDSERIFAMGSTIAARPPAEIYDERFVPALFAGWGPVVAGVAGIAPGQTVLDVACGTGALTLAAAEAVGPEGHVTGLDANPEMLAVARRKPVAVDWVEARAEALPFEDGRFDAVVSQFAFMFFDDKPRSLAEMMRVLRPGGRLAVAVCDAVERSPGYGAFAALLDRLFGREVGDAFRAPFSLGNDDELMRLAAAAGIGGARVEQRTGVVRFRSIAELVSTERACVWTLGGILDDAQFERLLQASGATLTPFRRADGTVRFDMPSLIVAARKPA